MKPAQDVTVIFVKASRSYNQGLAFSIVTLRDLAQLYLLHTGVLEPGASLDFGRGMQSHNCAENLLSETIQLNHVPSL